MKAAPVQKRAQLKRQLLIDAARDSFAEDGYEYTTAKRIAARAGVATGTFYQHFDNKDDALCILAERWFEALDTRIERAAPLGTDSAGGDTQAGATKALFARTLALLFETHEQGPELHQIFEQRRGLYAQLDAIMQRGEALMHGHVLRYVQSFNVRDPQTTAFTLYAMAEGLVHQFVFSETTLDRDRVIEQGAAMLAAYFDALSA